MTSKTGDTDKVERLLAHARQLYQNLAHELTCAIRVLHSGAEDLAARGRAETIRAHRKALQTIIDIELQLAKETRRPEQSHEIDIEAARAEIYRRLDRLASAGGD
ncbi:hypothetical protein [Pikeienuella sp. HZG-20]|uniref:hypothetical protein n=1 Tax=Paludibacillus litoralis TaxID=3133267 RepID=UPI0030EBC1FB